MDKKNNFYFILFSGEWAQHFPHLLLDPPVHLVDSLWTEEFHCPGVSFIKLFFGVIHTWG
jgi:hypothetical protein